MLGTVCENGSGTLIEDFLNLFRALGLMCREADMYVTLGSCWIVGCLESMSAFRSVSTIGFGATFCDSSRSSG